MEAIKLEDMRSNADKAVNLLRSLAHEDRLMLLCQLCQQEMCVGELEQALDIRQPSLSQQLGVLRRDGLVSTRRQGKHIYYRVKQGPALDLLQALHKVYCNPQSNQDSKLTGEH
nr:metalloregulator ArsR/SmtB family transcription factor [Pseudohongiella spirulinae]